MHVGQTEWLRRHRGKISGRVCEVGSRDENGNISDKIPKTVSEYIRTDMREGQNVDLVVRAEDLVQKFGPESFDTVLCFDTLEHMKDIKACLRSMWGTLKPGGWFIGSVASPAKRYHGYPEDYWRPSRVQLQMIFPNVEVIDEKLSFLFAVEKKQPLNLDLSIKKVDRKWMERKLAKRATDGPHD